jgi:hypothetical protein
VAALLGEPVRGGPRLRRTRQAYASWVTGSRLAWPAAAGSYFAGFVES